MWSPAIVWLVLCHLCAFIPQVQAQEYWRGLIQERGNVAFGDPTYPVFRNVMRYGAKGDGINDDSDAINNAIAFPGVVGNSSRCGEGTFPAGQRCPSQTTTPALVYFPPGIYRVSKPLVQYYFTQMVGDARNPPTILVAGNFSNVRPIVGVSVFDANIYIPGFGGGGLTWWANQNNFYRQIRNFVLDLTLAPNQTSAIHWQVAQATSIQNVEIRMRPKESPGNQQVGINMENGSGGFYSDISISGGLIGMSIGSQQFTTRNVKIDGSATAVKFVYNWIWTFAQMTITNCNVGFDMSNGGFANQAVSAVIIIDSVISARVGIVTVYAPGFSSPQSGGTLMLERVDFTGSTTAVAVGSDSNSRVILQGGRYIQLFGQGNAWTTANGQPLNGQIFNSTSCTFQNSSQITRTASELTIQRELAPIPRPASLVDANGNIVGRSRPQYPDTPLSGILSAKAFGLRGDGATDDTILMRSFFQAAAAAGQIAYFDRGAYIVTDTVQVPKDLKITGELLSIVMFRGPLYGDQFNPRVGWRIGSPGEIGTVEITDLVFETQGPAPGCIVIQWNIKQAYPGGAGMWDAHWRIGGSAGTQLQMDNGNGKICTKSPSVTITASDPRLQYCAGAFLLLHVTPQANGYFENTWGWVADHELDQGIRDQIYVFNGRGFLFESEEGPNWLWGTAAEHSTLYNYQFVNAKNIWMGHIQHETAYFQGNPDSLLPYTPQASWHDPDFSDCDPNRFNCKRTWAARFVNCTHIFNYGAGHYHFFNNWDSPGCLDNERCQERMVDFRNSSDIYMWGLSTKGSEFMVSWEGTDLVPQQVNKAGYTETILLFELASI